MASTSPASNPTLAEHWRLPFTGRWRQGLYTFVLNAGRLSLRVSAYGRLLTDTYPTLRLTVANNA